MFCFVGGPYAGFAGRDASRGLATFNVDAITDEYDDLSDLKNSELEQVKLQLESPQVSAWGGFQKHVLHT